MKFDTADAFYANAPLSSLHNVISHELGHVMGLSHVCPITQTKLMEPILATAFVGMQHDDVRGAQRGYGDRFELPQNPNDTQAAATPLPGNVNNAVDETITDVSLDSTSDADWFSFETLGAEQVTLQAIPVGSQYLNGPAGSPPPGESVCSVFAPQLIDSAAIQNITVELFDDNGLIASAGPGDTIDQPVQDAGTYFVRVSGAGTNDTQMYDLSYTRGPDAQPARIGNRVWSDLNGDGRSFGGEPGVAGVTVEVLDSNGDLFTTRTTSATGFWNAEVDASEAWTIRVLPPAGTGFTTQDAGNNDTKDSDADAAGLIDVPLGSLTPGQFNTTFDAGLIDLTATEPARIGNRVWNDTNGDGLSYGGEPGVAGVTVEVLDSNGAVFATRTTSATGYWNVAVDADEAWTIRVAPPTGSAFTTANVGANDANDSDADAAGLIDVPLGSLTPGEFNTTFDAGLIDLTATEPARIGNRVWNDINGDGRSFGGEPGVAGVTVEVLDSNGAVFATRTTSATGFWNVEVDANEAWTIRVTAPAGTAFTTQDVGANDTKDSDADAAGLINVPLGSLTPGEFNTTFDAGLVNP